ncbi:MAG: hypothetical protein PHT18_02240, partial [Proteiniphilum sp.]|nr:hypothetical protein [Proteiniphilum sp.]
DEPKAMSGEQRVCAIAGEVENQQLSLLTIFVHNGKVSASKSATAHTRKTLWAILATPLTNRQRNSKMEK